MDQETKKANEKVIRPKDLSPFAYDSPRFSIALIAIMDQAHQSGTENDFVPVNVR